MQVILLLVAAIGWAALWHLSQHLTLPAQCGINLGHWLDWGWDGLALLLLLNPPETMLLGWAVMVAAMMAPLLAGPLGAGRVSDGLAFLAVYFGLWLLAGVALMTLAIAVSLLPGAPLAYGLLIAGLWQITALKLRSLARCHTCGGGGAVGFTLACIGACWTWMLLPLLVQESLHFITMIVAAVLMAVERFLVMPSRRR
ncbi:hypothetical protein VZ95_06050 [Elstera litoralis]|uniref:DUF2182 domain-containing protein n=2 Tax=Elstera litoralis TaxID=552518 RepID=A0A0F3IU48_9PROT|nr:hypothetical protein VZ95_06050 [Elstera litoralis]